MRSEVRASFRLSRLGLEPCESCGRRDWLRVLAYLLPRFVRLDPATALSVVLRWELRLGPLWLIGYVPDADRPAALQAHRRALDAEEALRRL